MNNIAPISDWRRVFIDTSFIIDAVRHLPDSESTLKYVGIRKTHQLIDFLKEYEENKQFKVRWITSSIVLSELTKFENTDAVNQLQQIFDSSEIEIVNFTKREAAFIVNEMANFIEQKHVNRFLKEMTAKLAQQDIFNPRNYVSKDALIVACAKSKPVDVVLTSAQIFMSI